MKKLMILLLLCCLAASGYAEVTDIVLKAFINHDVIVVKADGTEISGQLASFDASVAVVIKASGDVVEIARKDLGSIRGKTESASSSPSANPSAGNLPSSPNLGAIKTRSLSERQSAFNDQLKLYADPLILAFKMGNSGRFFPFAQWEPVLKEAPEAYQLFLNYNGRKTTSIIFQIAGLVLLIPGGVMSILGPFLVGIIFDCVSIVASVVALIVLPSAADFQKIADSYNRYLGKSLNLSAAWSDQSSMLAMLPGQAATRGTFEIRLLSLPL